MKYQKFKTAELTTQFTDVTTACAVTVNVTVVSRFTVQLLVLIIEAHLTRYCCFSLMGQLSEHPDVG